MDNEEGDTIHRENRSLKSNDGGFSSKSNSFPKRDTGFSETEELEEENEMEDNIEDRFVPTKNFGFRFSREQLMDIKRGINIENCCHD
jgi:hypothetical protein